MGDNRSMSANDAVKDRIQIAESALRESVDAGAVGDHIASVVDADGLIAEHFACQLPGYVGWYWAVSLSALAGDDATINDVVLLPGDHAILAPAWTPYRDRVEPGDLKPGVVLPPEADDIRLAPGWFVGDGDGTGAVARHYVREIGLGRQWVLSIEGREDAADRWYAGELGPDTPMAEQAPGRCGSCGFVVGLAGDLADRFGVCANRYAGADGKVVAFTHGCGAHSGKGPRRSQSSTELPDHALDTLTLDEIEPQ